ncbi:TniQ family protein [Mycolicibacterium sp.]|uniref:TniQ family protein n=1 Tax=Mycolicibacterium sp. TaxID=2320850 RepID=UPI0037CA7394
MINDWPRLPPRPLPQPVTAFRDETVYSFTTRLAHANQLPPQSLRDYAAREGHYVDPDRLARLSGYPRHVLCDRLRGLTVDERDLTRQRARARPICRFCSARRGVPEPVHCWLPDHLTVCHRHGYWIGPSAQRWDDQMSLKHHPAIAQAARAHRALAKRNTSDIVELAINDASRIVLRQIRFRRSDGLGDSAATGIALGGRWASISTVKLHIDTYVETVRMATVIIDHRPQLLNCSGNPSLARIAVLAAANAVFGTEAETATAAALDGWLNNQQIIRESR